MKKKLLFTLLPIASAFTFVSAGCNGNAEESKLIKIYMPSDGMEYTNDVQQKEMLDIINPKLKKYNIQAEFQKAGGDDKVTLNDVLTNDNVIAFPAVSKYYLDNANYLDSTNVFMRTLTNAFKNNLSSAGYSEGEDNYLIKQAKNQNEIFNSHNGYANWPSKDYINSTYEWCYEPNKTVGWQRGSIWIMGTDEELAKIKEAWNTRNYEEFRKFGIIMGKEDSGSKYLLPQALFRKQFNKYFANSSFSEELNNAQLSSYYTKSLKAKDMGKQKSYKIAFDNEMAFAYTKSDGKKYVVNQKENPGAKLEILTVTDAIPYNIGVASKNIKQDILNAILDGFKETVKLNKNFVGVAYGFNDYAAVTNVNDEIIKMCKEAGI
ncbi:ABC transporter thiamine pyrophosphate-binding lipoprotein p37/Cypl [Mycoplasmopsis adleri]|uniref:ABC transporter thiamine pyrophosphate-binding lipoprotein p37/Cypl n=1 Tax=Mycoplasmopsis adleri TaxID=51362 RepID=UPI003873204B